MTDGHAKRLRALETGADSSAALLRELVAHLRQHRAELRKEWAHRIAGARLLSVMTEEEIFAEVTSVYDNYVEALETGTLKTGTLKALQAYARNLSGRIIPRGVQTDEVLGVVLLLRDVLARSFFARYQSDFRLLNRILDAYEPAANRIASTVAVGFVRERERVIREQQEAIRGARVWRRLTETLENEAKRIAHALHDEAGQLLASVHIAIAGIADELPPRHRERLNEVKWLLGKIETELRNLSHELRPMVLDRLGLGPALQFLAENVGRRAGVAIAVSGELGARLAPAVEITLYRIAQEALNNVVKHARASAVHIEVQHSTERVSCTVRDDGVGFSTNGLEGSTGLGLVGIRERLGALGGSVHIASQPGSGTTLRAEIPLRR
jgi:signal transduction histidine kinase